MPTTRTDWINANSANQPSLTVVQLVNGPVGDRSVVPVNGDLYYQAFDPAIRSLRRAMTYFDTPGNTAISQNEQRALQVNNRALMRFSSGIVFDSRLLNLVLPEVAADGVNIIHKAILPLDFDNVTNFEDRLAAMGRGLGWAGLVAAIRGRLRGAATRPWRDHLSRGRLNSNLGIDDGQSA